MFDVNNVSTRSYECDYNACSLAPKLLSIKVLLKTILPKDRFSSWVI